MSWRLAALEPDQHQRINSLEKELGVVLVAWDSQERGATALSAQNRAHRDFEIARELGGGPEVQAALNEAYRSLDE